MWLINTFKTYTKTQKEFQMIREEVFKIVSSVLSIPLEEVNEDTYAPYRQQINGILCNTYEFNIISRGRVQNSFSR